MSLTYSEMNALGTKVPLFELPSTSGEIIKTNTFKDAKGLLVFFICNHCPYVIHIQKELIQLANDYGPKGIQFIGINSNDYENYPDDSPRKMREVARMLGYPFPYLFDETQNVARSFRAQCTPDFFLYDEKRELIYRGRMDGSSPGNDIPNDGADLRNAFDKFLQGEGIVDNQIPSMGCNIKWKTSR